MVHDVPLDLNRRLLAPPRRLLAPPRRLLAPPRRLLAPDNEANPPPPRRYRSLSIVVGVRDLIHLRFRDHWQHWQRARSILGRRFRLRWNDRWNGTLIVWQNLQVHVGGHHRRRRVVLFEDEIRAEI